MIFDLEAFVKAAGYIGLFAIIFAESGLLIGFFLPGDSLLFTAGFLASQGFLDLGLLMAVTFVAAVLGDNVGYSLGNKFGPKVFSKDDSFFFNKDHLERSERFYARHGGKTIILARFMPVVRTFAPILAGVGNMRYPVFFVYNLIGGALWALGLPLLGYYLGSTIPDIDRYLLPIIAVIVLISILPALLHLLRNKGRRQALINFFRSKLGN